MCKLSKSDFENIPVQAIVVKKETKFGYSALVKKDEINKAIATEKTSLEDIILFMAKEES